MIQRCFITVLFLSLLIGCANVFSTQPIGLKPYQIKEEDWKGVWFNKDAAVSIKVVDGCNGVIKVAWVEWKDNDAKLECHEVQLRQFDKWMFGNVKDTDANGKGVYLMGADQAERRPVDLLAPRRREVQSPSDKLYYVNYIEAAA